MIKRLSASSLVVLALAGCQQVAHEEAPKEEMPAAVEVATPAQQKKDVDYTPRVINVNEVRFMPNEVRSQNLGEDWDKNKSLTDYIDPDKVGVRIDMSKDRKVDLKYDKEFALKVSAKNPKGYGAVSISSQWVKDGKTVKFEAIKDAKADFLRWEGDIKDGVTIEGQEITVLMDRPRTIHAVYASKKNEVVIDSKYGDPQGAGVYDRGQKATWSVTSPFKIAEDERVVAPVASGTIDGIEDDKIIKIDWQKEYMLKTVSGKMGEVKGGNIWVQKGTTATIEAVPADPSIGFVKWLGIEGAMASTNPLELTMDRPYILKPVFTKQKYNLTVNTAFGEATGNGLQPARTEAAWSVTSPVATDNPDVRMAASPATGKISMTSDKTVTVNWVKEFKVKVSKKTAAGEITKVGDVWVKEGEMLKDYTLDFPAESKDKVYSWSGNIPRESKAGPALSFKVTEPVEVTANLFEIKTELVITNTVDNEADKFKHDHTDLAEYKVKNIHYVNGSERLVLDKGSLKEQVENVSVEEKKKIKLENTSNIQIVDFAGWKDCVRIKTAFAQVIISPQAGRVVYFGSPDNKTNLLWLNEDHVGKVTTKADATEDWADKGGSRVWIAPLQARGVLTGKKFPPAYEVDGAPYQNTIINGNKVVVQNFPNSDYGCKIQRTFELKKNKLYIETALIKTNDTKHHYLLGPLMLTQFVRPDRIRFIRSGQPKDHPKGYVMIKGEEPDFKKDELDDNRFKLDIPKSYESEVKVGTYTPFTQLEYKGYILNTIAKYNKNAVFPEKNSNLTIFFPEAPTDYIEIGNFGELYEISDKKHVSEVIWALEIR